MLCGALYADHRVYQIHRDSGGTKMASNKSGMRGTGGGASRSELAGALLAIVAGGVAGGTLLVAGAKALGDKLLEKQVSDYEKLERQREADKEEARRITAAENGEEL
jgi:hypothetical protein